MKTEQEKELDELFRKGLENPSPNTNFRENDWDAMEALLDAGKKQWGMVFWLPIIGLAAGLLIVSGWFLFNHNNDKPTVVKTNPAKQPVYNGREITKTDPTASQQQTNTPVKADAEVSQGAIHNSKGVDGEPNKITGFNSAESKYAGRGTHGKGRLPLRITSGNEINIQQASVENPDNGQTLAANWPALNLSELDGGLLLDTGLPETDKPEIAANPVKTAIKQNSINRPRLAITVLASPDINGVSSFQNSEIGTNAGLMFSVGLTKKLSISTGAVYSKKPYLTDFNNYHTSYKFKTDPQNVTADCRVLDIPVNINYQVYSRANNRFSVGTGVSSYIMLRESYHYNYGSPYTSGPTDYNVTNRNQHILGVLNLDVTYQRQLNSKFSIGVEPYMKIPLTNIGYSQVKLQSAGVAVGVTWNINSLSKP